MKRGQIGNEMSVVRRNDDDFAEARKELSNFFSLFFVTCSDVDAKREERERKIPLN